MTLELILEKDCLEGLQSLDTASADIIICDPPYNIGKDFGNDSDKRPMDVYLDWCESWLKECVRVIKPRGTIYVYGFSEILAHIQVRLQSTCPVPVHVRWLIWHYTNKTVPSLQFWQRSHESILCCHKEKPHFNRDKVREPYTQGFIQNAAGKTRKSTQGRFSKGDKETTYKAHAGGALPRDVIKIPALAGGAGKKERVNHPTQKPLELCKRLIQASMQESGPTLLIVPFVGSGSECVAAQALGVDFIGYEINPEYVELSLQRLKPPEPACTSADPLEPPPPGNTG